MREYMRYFLYIFLYVLHYKVLKSTFDMIQSPLMSVWVFPSSSMYSRWSLKRLCANNMRQVLHLLFPLEIKFIYWNSELPLELKVKYGRYSCYWYVIHLYFSKEKEVKQTLREILQSVGLSGIMENCACQMHNTFEAYRCCTKHASEQNSLRNKKKRKGKRRENKRKRERARVKWLK